MYSFILILSWKQFNTISKTYYCFFFNVYPVTDLLNLAGDGVGGRRAGIWDNIKSFIDAF